MTLLFDLDDTLVPSTKAYAYGLEAIGLRPDDSLFLQARQEVKHTCPPGYPGARSRRLYFKRLLELRGAFTAQAHLEIVATYEDAVCGYIAHAWQALGRDELFTQLRKMSKKIGIITNETAIFQSAKINALDPVAQYFDFIVTSEDVGAEKPAAVIFNRALELAQTPISECLFIGDSFDHDIAGAEALGLRAIQTIEFLASEKLHSQVISRLADLPALIH